MNSPKGQLVLKTLQELGKPAPALMISQQIANAVEAEVSDVIESVRYTLDDGVCYGYIQCHNHMYFIKRIEGVNVQKAKLDNGSNNNLKNSNEVQELMRKSKKKVCRPRRLEVGSRRRRRQ